MDLIGLRNKIDLLDEKLLCILKERMMLIPQVAEYKKKNNIDRYQPTREKEVIGIRRELAKKLDLNPEFVEVVFKEIIKDAHRIEKEIMGK